VRQQLSDSVVLLRRQSPQHILRVGIGIIPVEFLRLDQAHDRCGQLALAGGLQIEELATGLRHAADLGHTLSETDLVTAIVVTDQLTARRDALVDHLGRHRRLDQCLAVRAVPYAADMAPHREIARDI
jgi:hypothetical protein